MSRIMVELTDLMNADRELTKLLRTLQENEQHVRAVTEGIADWKGQAADELRNRLNVFFKGLQNQIHFIEERKTELVKYTYRMERIDQQ